MGSNLNARDGLVHLEIPQEWFRKHSVVELIKIRTEYYNDPDNEECSCDHCIMATICSLAYDRYNTNGDCLLEK